MNWKQLEIFQYLKETKVMQEKSLTIEDILPWLGNIRIVEKILQIQKWINLI